MKEGCPVNGFEKPGTSRLCVMATADVLDYYRQVVPVVHANFGHSEVELIEIESGRPTITGTDSHNNRLIEHLVNHMQVTEREFAEELPDPIARRQLSRIMLEMTVKQLKLKGHINGNGYHKGPMVPGGPHNNIYIK